MLKPTMTLAKNEISPSLSKMLAKAQSPEDVWMAAGTQVLGIARRAFTRPAMRQQSWPAKRSGEASRLTNKGTLLASLRIIDVGRDHVSVGSDRPYAAIHQLGGVIKPKTGKALRFFSGGRWWTAKQVRIPARPYFPFTPSGEVAPQFKDRIQKIIDKAMRTRLGIK